MSIFFPHSTRSIHAKIIGIGIWDATTPKDKVIYVSDYACSHDMRGQQIIAHEIAHNISHLFSKLQISKESLKAYLDIRNCVSDHYPKRPIISNGRFPSDKQHTEEDMAQEASHVEFYTCKK